MTDISAPPTHRAGGAEIIFIRPVSGSGVLYWALIWSPRNLKIFFAGIPQGPLETSHGTLKKIQKRVRGPQPGVFEIFSVC